MINTFVSSWSPSSLHLPPQKSALLWWFGLFMLSIKKMSQKASNNHVQRELKWILNETQSIKDSISQIQVQSWVSSESLFSILYSSFAYKFSIKVLLYHCLLFRDHCTPFITEYLFGLNGYIIFPAAVFHVGQGIHPTAYQKDVQRLGLSILILHFTPCQQCENVE